MNFFILINRLIAKIWALIFTRKKEARWAAAFVRRLEQQYGKDALDEETFKKIIGRYAVYTLMICDAFTSLRKRQTNRAEKERILRFMICSALFDNFCDRNKWPREQLYNIIYNTETYPARQADEKLFRESFLLLKKYVREPETYEKVTQKLFEAQIDSIRQFDKSTKDAEIERITFEKGGYSVLFCSFYLEETTSQTEKNCWYQIGCLIQLINDLFDIYKDLQDRSETLPLRMTDARAFDRYFSGLVQSITDEMDKLPFPLKRKLDLMVSVSGICSFGKLALQQLITIQGNRPRLPEFHTLPRKALIVDMEKPGNIWYCIRYMYRHTSRWLTQQSKKPAGIRP